MRMFDMPQKASEKNRKKRRLNVVRGKSKKKLIITLSVIAAIVIGLLLFQILSPTGIYETIQNAYALTVDNGDNSFTDPQSEAVSFESTNNAAFLLTTSYFEIFNKKGNNVLYFKHGFSDPIMDTSNARVIVYDRGGKSYKIFNYSAALFEGNTAGNIISADIGRNGSYALITESVGKASELCVYSKNHSLEFKWYSEHNVISSAVLNRWCDRVAVCELFVSSGAISSRIDVMKIGKGEPEFSVDLNNTVITSLTNCFGKIVAASENKIFIINWKNGEYTEIDLDGVISFMEVDNSGNLMLTYARSDKQTFNTVLTLNDDLETVSKTEINAVLSDVRTYDGATYAVFDNTLHIYDAAGTLTEIKKSEYNILKIAYMNRSNGIAACGTGKVFIIN